MIYDSHSAMYDFLSSVKHKRRYFMKVLFFLHTMTVNRVQCIVGRVYEALLLDINTINSSQEMKSACLQRGSLMKDINTY